MMEAFGTQSLSPLGSGHCQCGRRSYVKVLISHFCWLSISDILSASNMRMTTLLTCLFRAVAPCFRNRAEMNTGVPRPHAMTQMPRGSIQCSTLKAISSDSVNTLGWSAIHFRIRSAPIRECASDRSTWLIRGIRCRLPLQSASSLIRTSESKVLRSGS